MVKDIKQHLMEQDHFARHVGVIVEEATPEYSRVSMPLGENQRNGVNLAHGGAIFTLADLAFAAWPTLGPNLWRLTPRRRFRFCVAAAMGRWLPRAGIRHSGRTLLTVDVDVRDADGVLLATAICTGCRTSRNIAD